MLKRKHYFLHRSAPVFYAGKPSLSLRQTAPKPGTDSKKNTVNQVICFSPSKGRSYISRRHSISALPPCFSKFLAVFFLRQTEAYPKQRTMKVGLSLQLYRQKPQHLNKEIISVFYQPTSHPKTKEKPQHNARVIP